MANFWPTLWVNGNNFWLNKVYRKDETHQKIFLEEKNQN